MISTRIYHIIFSLFLLVHCKVEGRDVLKPWYGKPSNSEADFINIWPLPKKLSSGNLTMSVDPHLKFVPQGSAAQSSIVQDAFSRYKNIIFKHHSKYSDGKRSHQDQYNVRSLIISVTAANETLYLGANESYSLFIPDGSEGSIIQDVVLEADTVYGALRGLETFSQLCTFNFSTRNVEIIKAPWVIQDEPRFAFRGLLIDTSRHYLPLDVIKQIIDSMSYAKLNVLHWHIVDEESFPLEVPSYPALWNGAYSRWERYTLDDALEVVEFAKSRGINIMAEIDVPGHAESWGYGYPDLWPSSTCREPLDVSKNFTFEVISGILSDLRQIFPFGLFHLGGDEVHEDCWNSSRNIKAWLDSHNMTTKDGYQYFVLKAQEIAISLGWTPVNWEETFKAFGDKLNPNTIVHNWLESGICPRAVAKGFKCIFSNQGVWYLDHLDVPWEKVYSADPLEGITNTSLQQLVIGGQVCMWGETADASDVQQTIWPRAAAAAERLWSAAADTSHNSLSNVLERIEYFKCLLNERGIAAAPVTNKMARKAPIGPGSCFMQ